MIKSHIFFSKCIKQAINPVFRQTSRNFSTSTADSKEKNPILRGIKLQHEALEHAENLEYYDALVKAVEALEITEQAFGSDHTYTAEALMKTADYYNIIGYYEKAMSDAKQAVDILKSQSTSHQPAFSDALSTYSKTLAAGGLYEEALKVEKAAHRIKQDLFGNNNIQTVRSLCALGDRYRLVGDTEQASKILTDCFQQSDQFFDNSQIDKFLLNLSLAELYIDKNDYDLAHYHVDRVLVGLKMLNQKKHPLIGKLHNTLGELELFDKDYEGALDALQKSVKFHEYVFEGSHPDLAITLTYLARLYLEKGDAEKAKSTQQEGIEMWKNFSADITHPQYSIMNLMLANIMRHTTDKMGAQKLTERSYSELVAKLGKNHPKTMYYRYVLENYANDMIQN